MQSSTRPRPASSTPWSSPPWPPSLPQQLGGGVAELIKPEIKGNISVGMLKSRTLQDWVLDRFGPEGWRDITGYGKENLRKDIVEEYIGEADALEDKDGTISLSVVSTDPVKAAEIANAHVEGLKWMADTFAVTGASQRRLYLEKELEKARVSLNRAEADFQKYQQETGVYMGEAQLTCKHASTSAPRSPPGDPAQLPAGHAA